jgi:hypothetical protein
VVSGVYPIPVRVRSTSGYNPREPNEALRISKPNWSTASYPDLLVFLLTV